MVATSPRPTVELERSDDLIALSRARRDRVRFVNVPEAAYFAIDGTEPPGSEPYMSAIGTLFPIAYALHFALRGRGVSHPVGMLEGLYWLTPEEVLDGEEPGVRADSDYHWRWRLLIAVPPPATEAEVEAAIRDAARRRPLPLIDRLQVVRWAEGPAAQLLHMGAYLAETPSIRQLDLAIRDAGFEPHGLHHEIYLNNPQQVGEENARTVIRRPIRPAAEPQAVEAVSVRR
ncbi:MAG TPA: hypothetical protein VK838_06695 [Candidatus Limnocylindrales bacterium]|nr:hypothetical protein [Candidatus Limnocylindrales bacterium]